MEETTVMQHIGWFSKAEELGRKKIQHSRLKYAGLKPHAKTKAK